MALAITKSSGTAVVPDQRLGQLVTQFNALLTVLRAQAVTYDADAGITATDFTAALDGGVSKIGDASGTAL
jgi:hypothetical protein